MTNLSVPVCQNSTQNILVSVPFSACTGICPLSGVIWLRMHEQSDAQKYFRSSLLLYRYFEIYLDYYFSKADATVLKPQCRVQPLMQLDHTHHSLLFAAGSS
ncbi:hypothetical protein CRM22_003145 [Opisthorchis felineus]|uniref:Uncharacterized protein n=1 Tax=Opisthorchis felineus TaxID=147828 RepID=A0A4S2M2R5_OPIFE|nr:hypothetical protein CRM22_003145 [Opisthorchis felineus]